MTGAEWVQQLRSLGCTLSVEDGNLRICGAKIPDSRFKDLENVKQDIIVLLGSPPASQPDWQRMRDISRHLGKRVSVNGRHCTLWGVSPRGAAVDCGAFIIGVDFDDVDVG